MILFVLINHLVMVVVLVRVLEYPRHTVCVGEIFTMFVTRHHVLRHSYTLFTLRGNLESPILLLACFLGGGRKPEETHRDTRIT